MICCQFTIVNELLPGWRKGYVVDCRPIHPGSNPGLGLEEFHVFRRQKTL